MHHMDGQKEPEVGDVTTQSMIYKNAKTLWIIDLYSHPNNPHACVH